MVHRKYKVTTPKDDLWEGYQQQQPSLVEEIREPKTTTSNGDVYLTVKKQVFIFLLPLLDVAILNVSIILCYVIGLSMDEMEPLPAIPFISEVGRNAPKSYIFSFGMASSSFLTFLIVFFRYKQVSFSRDNYLNNISAAVGGTAALSKLLIGAFQYNHKFRWLHYSAFLSYAFFSYIFIVAQVFLTYYTKTKSSTAIFLIRLVVALQMIVFGALFVIFMLPRFARMNIPPYNVGQIAQWIYWTLLNTYTLTFMKDFTRIRVSWNVRNSPTVQVVPSGESMAYVEDSHELYCAESEGNSNEMSRLCYASSSLSVCSQFNIPIEFTTKV